MARLEIYVPVRGKNYHFSPGSGWLRPDNVVASLTEVQDISKELPSHILVLDGFLLHEGEFYSVFDGRRANKRKTQELYRKLQVALNTKFEDRCFDRSADMYLYECVLGNGCLRDSKRPTLVNCRLGKGSLEGAEKAVVFSKGKVSGVYNPKKAILICNELGRVYLNKGTDVVVLTSKTRARSKRIQVYLIEPEKLYEIQEYIKDSEERILSATNPKERKQMAEKTREYMLRHFRDIIRIDEWIAA